MWQVSQPCKTGKSEKVSVGFFQSSVTGTRLAHNQETVGSTPASEILTLAIYRPPTPETLRMTAESDIVDFQLRHGTQDKQVFDEVYVKNQYRLPDSLPADSLVIDIGANIGAFAVACLMRGAGTVVCFEPCQHNFQQLVKNTAGWPGRVAAFNAAVWRSDKNERIKFVGSTKNTACGGVAPWDSNAVGDFTMAPVFVESMGLDDLLLHATDGGIRKVDILKIDAEGSEYPILYTSKRLQVVDKIIGETHQFSSSWPDEDISILEFSTREACAAGMKRFLENQGFSVTQADESPDNTICTLFFAQRTPTPETA